MFCDLGRIMRDGFTRTATRIENSGKSLNVGRLGFAKDERGNMTMVFGFSIMCAVAFVGMTVDFGRGYATKEAMDRALDQASLAAGRTFDGGGALYANNTANQNNQMQMKDAAIVAEKYFFQTLPKNIKAQLTSVKVDAQGNVKMTARANVKTMFLAAIGMPTIRITSNQTSMAMDTDGATSQKLEIALVMDVTGSMNDNAKLTTAKVAAKRLVDVLIPPGSTNPNVRVSIVPFSEYVNAGAYAEAATGVAASTTSNYTCTTQQQVCQTVSNTNGNGQHWSGGDWENDQEGDYDDDQGHHRGGGHGNNGWGNGGDDGHNGSGNGGSGDWGNRSAMSTNRSAGGGGNCTGGSQGGGYGSHGYDNDGYDRDGYDRNGHNNQGHSGGSGSHQVCTTQLVQATCQRTSYVNTCMAERLASTGHAYDDAAPSTQLFHAFTTTSASSRNCTAPDKPLLPLTNNRTDLYASIDAQHAAGYTAGHIGMAWGWYTISDKWTSFWPAGSKPAAADPALVKKVVLMMTDGAYNLHYDTNYASIAEDNNANATVANGRSRSQAATLCTNMKAAGVEVFTVGLELGSDTTSKTALQACASPWNANVAQHFYDVTSAAASQNGLISVFTDIANRLASATGTGNHRTRITY